MALYEKAAYLNKTADPEFTKKHAPGNAAPFAGIYRCVVCGHEIGIAEGHTLPSQSHAQHSSTAGKIEWQLIVYAQHNK